MAIRTSIPDARDPALVPGIYNMCDHWCLYCHATAWCLAYRYRLPMPPGGGADRDPTDALVETIVLLEERPEAEGAAALAAAGPARRLSDDLTQAAHVALGDPLLAGAERYARLASVYLRGRPDARVNAARGRGGPTPLAVVAWYHLLTPAKVFRALLADARATPGDDLHRRDALASAKVALIGLDRSHDALGQLVGADEDPRLPALEAAVRQLRTDLEARFPDARAFVRPGLDEEPPRRV